MKILLISILLIFNFNTYAYKVGDTVSPDIAQHLKLNKNGVTAVNFFASWCVSCRKELPLVNTLSKTIAKHYSIVGVDSDEELKEGLAFQKALGLTFYVYNDVKQKVTASFNPIGMPALYYVKNNKVVKIRIGAINHIDKVIQKDLESLK
ncbi:MAG: TlpA family protein disulfide reductase [Gammaproteobacteria bacterium]|nr:TlpA family protein disulfide reductase [Gammaproteobacteria bacterium]